MRPYIPADKVAQVDLIYDCNGEICENVYNVLGTAEWTGTLLASLITAVVGWETTSGSTLRTSGCGAVKIVATDLSSQTGPSIIRSITPTINGINTGTMPNNVTVAIKLGTDQRGRSFRGRTYWIGLWPTAVFAQQINASVAGQLLTSIGLLQAAVGTVNGGKLAVVSRRTGNNPRVAALVTPVTTFSIDPNLDSQRRRLPGHNRHR